MNSARTEKGIKHVDNLVLEADFPEAVGGQTIRTEEFLLHIATHLAYHLGQLDYHRRLVTGEAGQIGVVAVKDLSTARPES